MFLMTSENIDWAERCLVKSPAWKLLSFALISFYSEAFEAEQFLIEQGRTHGCYSQVRAGRHSNQGIYQLCFFFLIFVLSGEVAGAINDFLHLRETWRDLGQDQLSIKDYINDFWCRARRCICIRGLTTKWNEEASFVIFFTIYGALSFQTMP